MRLFPLSAALAAILTAGSLPAVVIEENFKGYADYDPAHENWMFRGVGGEVIGGEYRFNGVAIEAAEEGDAARDKADDVCEHLPSFAVFRAAALKAFVYDCTDSDHAASCLFYQLSQCM